MIKGSTPGDLQGAGRLSDGGAAANQLAQRGKLGWAGHPGPADVFLASLHQLAPVCRGCLRRTAGARGMSSASKIEWTEVTWNPTTGCDRISAGCDHCYALTLAKRLKAMGQAKYQNDGDPRTSGPGFGLTLHPDALRLPYSWRGHRTVFVNSMSDLFHARVPLGFVRDVFAVIADTPQHTYQVLTKRSSRLPKVAGKLDWPSNLWMGVSVEDATTLSRVDDLRAVPAALRFLSCEPLIGPLDGLDLAGIDWLIIGGESGSDARRMNVQWVRDLLRKCQQPGVSTAPFVKQLGSVAGRELGAGSKGGDWERWPEDLRFRRFPSAARAAAAS
jgi:protein gp37